MKLRLILLAAAAMPLGAYAADVSDTNGPMHHHMGPGGEHPGGMRGPGHDHGPDGGVSGSMPMHHGHPPMGAKGDMPPPPPRGENGQMPPPPPLRGQGQGGMGGDMPPPPPRSDDGAAQGGISQ